MSSLILARAVTPLKGRCRPRSRSSIRIRSGQTEVVPVATPSFAPEDALSVVFQVSNYGAPDADLTIDYAFFRMDGTRRLFNRTAAQQLSDEDLPPPGAWDTQAFAMQNRAAAVVPAGALLSSRSSSSDRLTRATATGTVAFSVGSEVR
mgnify:CR=1 FL=1